MNHSLGFPTNLFLNYGIFLSKFYIKYLNGGQMKAGVDVSYMRKAFFFFLRLTKRGRKREMKGRNLKDICEAGAMFIMTFMWFP